MSCKSWSLPAGPGHCVGFTNTENSTCHYCYAGGGRYVMPNVKKTQEFRHQWWTKASSLERVDVLVDKISRMRIPYIRVFDSGDFGSIQDIIDWHDIANLCPGVKFWFSTKSWIKPEFTSQLIYLSKVSNVVVRRSALLLDSPAGKHPIQTTAEVHTDGFGCPKQVYGSCGKAKCRRCWDRGVAMVHYKLHGYAKKWKT